MLRAVSRSGKPCFVVGSSLPLQSQGPQATVACLPAHCTSILPGRPPEQPQGPAALYVFLMCEIIQFTGSHLPPLLDPLQPSSVLPGCGLSFLFDLFFTAGLLSDLSVNFQYHSTQNPLCINFPRPEKSNPNLVIN